MEYIKLWKPPRISLLCVTLAVEFKIDIYNVFRSTVLNNFAYSDYWYVINNIFNTAYHIMKSYEKTPRTSESVMSVSIKRADCTIV